MATQSRLHKHQVADLQIICDLEASELDHLIEHLRGLKPPPLQPKDLRKALTTVFQDREAVVEAVLRQMLSLYALIGQMGLSMDEVLKGLLFGIQNSEPRWEEKQIEKWKQRQPKLRELFSLDSVRLVSKALNLSYEYQNLLRTARVLTDIRPVFNLDATDIEGAVISHTLNLRFDNVDGDHSMSLALDESDVKSLKQQCERAILKAETARKSLKDKAGFRVIVPGKEEDESS